jgi:hypothetical protein
MAGVVEVNPSVMADVGSHLTGVADGVHTAVDTCAGGQPTCGAADGFATTAIAASSWTGLQPALLASGARVAQFGDDIDASGAAWRDIDTANAQHFRPPAGRDEH